MTATISGATGAAKQIATITLLGFMAVVLSGPAIAVAGALLPFFLVGSAVWLLYKTVTLGPRIAFGMVRGTLRTAFQVVFGLPVFVARKLWEVIPAFVKTIVDGILYIPLKLIRCGIAVLRGIGGVIPEALSGAVIGGILGLVGGMQHQDAEVRIPVAAALGLVIGVLFALTRTTQQKQDHQIQDVLPA